MYDNAVVASRQLILMCPACCYCIVMASTGQTSTQAPQSMQASGSTLALPSAMLIASLGHSETQLSQPVHFSSSTCAGIYITLS